MYKRQVLRRVGEKRMLIGSIVERINNMRSPAMPFKLVYHTDGKKERSVRGRLNREYKDGFNTGRRHVVQRKEEIASPPTCGLRRSRRRGCIYS